jgi:putative endonuclease
MYFVYILESIKSKRYYIGQTNNLNERVVRHNSGRNLSTKAYLPWELKWWKEYETRADAINVEHKIKGLKKRDRINAFVEENNFRGVAQPG